MEIIRHLSNEELTDLTVESDQQSLRSTLEALPEWARASTDHGPKNSGREQRSARLVTYSLLGEPGLRLTGSALAVAGVVGRDRTGTAGWIHARSRFLLHLTKLSWTPTTNSCSRWSAAVHNNGPAALDPAALLAEEMVQDILCTSPDPQKGVDS